MFSGPDSQRLQFSNTGAVWNYFALTLCGLLLLFSVNPRAAHFGIQSRNLKLATTQSFLASDEARLEAAIAALLLLGCVAILRVPAFIACTSATVGIPDVLACDSKDHDRESHLRPPPPA